MTTTIEITDEQKEELDSRKKVKTESYKSVVQRLLEDDTPEDRMREIAREEIDRVRGR